MKEMMMVNKEVLLVCYLRNIICNVDLHLKLALVRGYLRRGGLEVACLKLIHINHVSLPGKNMFNDAILCFQVPGPLAVVARHQTGDRPQQGEGPDHPPPARLISEQCTMCANKVFGGVFYVCVFTFFTQSVILLRQEDD